MNTKHVALRLIFVAALVGSAPPAMARDTDIYLSPPRTARNDAPNVMLIVDTSRFMAEEVQTSIYNADGNYCPGATYDCYDPHKLYWVSGEAGTPATDSAQWLQWKDALGTRVLTNNCASTATILSTKGWASAKFINWAGTDSGRWAQLSSTFHNPPYIECDETEPNNLYVAKNASTWSNAYTTNSKQEFDFSINTIALYTGDYLNFLRYRPATTTAPRLEVTKDVLKTIIDTNPGVRFGLMVFNRNWKVDPNCPLDANNVRLPCNGDPPNGGRVLMAIGDLDQPVDLPDGSPGTRRAYMKIAIDSLSLTPDGYVQAAPLAETLYEAYRYFSRNPVQYGDDHEQYEGVSLVPPRYLLAETGGTQLAGGTYITPFSYQCQQAYIVYITAGHPEYDTDADGAIQALTGAACGGSCLDELAGYMYNNDLVTTGLDGTQRVVTATVGFGNLSAAETELLQSAAYKGHGRYVTVNDATDLVGALRDTLVSIQVTNASFAAPSLSVNAFNKLFNRDEVYFALFTPSTTVRWDGNIKKFTLCTSTVPPEEGGPCAFGDVVYNGSTPAIDSVTQRIKQEAMSDWNTALEDGGTVTLGGAGSKVPDPANRILYTYTGSYPVTAGGVNLATGTATNPEAYLVKDTNVDLTGTLLGLPDDTERANLINWMRGQDVYNQDQDSSTTKRWRFGDPLHSRPVAITYGCANAVNGTCAATAPPVIKLFVGTNDGAVRIINDKNGVEEWAFFPKEVLTTQRTLSQDADGVHPDGMDGTPSFWVIDNNQNGIIEPGNSDKVYMYIGMRRGGRYIYAFDVTPTNTLTDPGAISTTTSGIVPKLLWVIRGDDANYAQLGETWSRPVIARIRWSKGGSTTDSEYKTVLIFGGGYDPNQDRAVWPGKDLHGNAIYMADPLTGARLWWASNTGSGANLELPYMDYSIPSDLALMDPDGDGAIDRIYVGDMAGQLWRIDLNPTLTSSDNRSKGFRLADVGCPNGTRGDTTTVCMDTLNQARRKFFYPPDVVQMDDTTYEDVDQSQYDLVVIGSGDREDPLDNLTYGNLTAPEAPVNNRVYAFRDYKTKNLVVTGETVPTTPIMEATAGDTTAAAMANKVYDVTANNVQSTNQTTQTTALLLIKAGSGWYLDLKDPTATKTYQPWVGEKVLAKAVAFDNAIYVTTYTPASDDTAQITCAASEGLAKLYTLDLGAGTPLVDNNGDGNLTTDDRSKNLGGGIPSELITVIRESGTSALVGTSGGAATPKISSDLPRFKTFWVEE